MRIIAFEVRDDEQEEFDRMEQKYGLTIARYEEPLSIENIELVKGYEGISTLGYTDWNRCLLDAVKKSGIQYISTRTVGYNHIDLSYAKEIGIHVCNSNYPADGVAEFTLMMMLLTLRNYKPAMWRQNVNDYSLFGLNGREITNQTVGIIGTGRIGKRVIELLQGFGCKILAYNRHEMPELKNLVTYVDLDTIYREADIISVHLPLKDNTYHMINRETITKMKDGVVLINTARGELMDIQALTEGIESEKIGALGLDVFENENGIYHADLKTDIIKNRDMVYLRQFPNVVMTQHMAFYTDTNIKSMVDCGIEGLLSMTSPEGYIGEL